MAQTIQINGTNYTYLVKADWQTDLAGQELAGQTPTERWARLVLAAPEGMPAADFDVIFALEGQQVSVAAPPYNDRNASNFITYYGAILEGVSGDHSGPLMTNVVCQLQVRL